LQHLCNELAIYLIIISHTVCANVTDAAQRDNFGQVIICLIFLTFAGNLAVCLYTSIRHAVVLYRRVRKYGNKLPVNLFKLPENKIASIMPFVEVEVEVKEDQEESYDEEEGSEDLSESESDELQVKENLEEGRKIMLKKKLSDI
jgi:hypothetical protein